MTKELEGLKEGWKAEIHVELLKITLKKISNWKTPGHDGIHGFWFKKFSSIHDRLALVNNTRTRRIQKDPINETVPNKYRPIPC